MRAKSVILLALALGCGLVAAIGVTQVISKDSKPAVQQGDTRSIIVATRDITPGELVTPETVKLEPWPKEKAPKDALSQIEKVEGCRARSEIYEGQPIRERMLIGQGFTRQMASDYIPKGRRVVGVKVDLVSGGAGLIQPGDRVDVLVHLSRDVKKGVPENRTQTILQDIKVFAVGSTFKIDPAADEEDAVQAKVIQLLVTPEQAETLVLAQQLGKVQLTIRPPGDEETMKTPGRTPAELLGETSVGERAGESPVADGSKSGGLFDLLNSMKAKSPPVTQQPAEPTRGDVWVMRVLGGAEMNDVMMEESTDLSGEHYWRIAGVGGMPPPGLPMNQPRTPPPAAGPSIGQEPAPTVPDDSARGASTE
jgi:pilus assembly protein CpaB